MTGYMLSSVKERSITIIASKLLQNDLYMRAGTRVQLLFCLRLDSNSSFKAHNRACKLRSRSSNINYHLEGRSELRDALTCEIGF